MSPANEDQSPAKFGSGICHQWWRIPNIYLATGLQNVCKALRCWTWTQAQRPFTNCKLLSCTRNGETSLWIKGTYTWKDRTTSVILNSVCMSVYVSRKHVWKWPTRKKDTWVKHFLHLVNHTKVSFWRTLSIKPYWRKCFVQKRYAHTKCEKERSRLTCKIHHLSCYLRMPLSVRFLHTHIVFSNLWWMLNKMRVIPWREGTKLPLCEFQVQCIHREGGMLLCHRHKHGFGCRVEELW